MTSRNLWTVFGRLLPNQKACKKELKAALEIYQKGFADEDNDGAGGGSGNGSGGGASGEPGSSVWGSDGMFVGDPNDKNAAALVLKAQLECLRRNYSKSLRLLSSCRSSDGGLDPVRGLAPPPRSWVLLRPLVTTLTLTVARSDVLHCLRLCT